MSKKTTFEKYFLNIFVFILTIFLIYIFFKVVFLGKIEEYFVPLGIKEFFKPLGCDPKKDPTCK
uniref:Uncharacterized protein n=1 Tax=viral metagenome TaxID=1070528 RepID=A0A6C0BVN4_9ZZZZ